MAPKLMPKLMIRRQKEIPRPEEALEGAREVVQDGNSLTSFRCVTSTRRLERSFLEDANKYKLGGFLFAGQ
jgi:hypothetical protein